MCSVGGSAWVRSAWVRFVCGRLGTASRSPALRVREAGGWGPRGSAWLKRRGAWQVADVQFARGVLSFCKAEAIQGARQGSALQGPAGPRRGRYRRLFARRRAWREGRGAGRGSRREAAPGARYSRIRVQPLMTRAQGAGGFPAGTSRRAARLQPGICPRRAPPVPCARATSYLCLRADRMRGSSYLCLRAAGLYLYKSLAPPDRKDLSTSLYTQVPPPRPALPAGIGSGGLDSGGRDTAAGAGRDGGQHGHPRRQGGHRRLPLQARPQVALLSRPRPPQAP